MNTQEKTFKKQIIEVLEEYFPKLNYKDVSKPSPNHRSEALALVAMACVFNDQSITEATKAERERCMNIVLQFQGEVEGADYPPKILLGSKATCLELRKRLK